MARGDITTVITVNMAPGDTTDRQPSAGVEEMFLQMGDVDLEGTTPVECPAISLQFIDGTNNQSNIVDGNAGNMADSWGRVKMVGDNTNYFRFVHQGASTGDYGFAVIEIG